MGLSDSTEVYQLHTGAFECSYEPLVRLDCGAQQGGVAFCMSEGKLAVAGDALCTVIDLESGATKFKMRHAHRLRCVALSSSGSTVVVGSFDNKVLLH